MAEQQTTSIDELAKENIPTTVKQWMDYIYAERVEVLRRLAQQSRKLITFPDINIEPTKTQYERFRVLLQKMIEYLQMTPEIRQKTLIDKYLRLLVLEEEHFHFPKSDIDAATLLIEKWEAEKFGANEVKEEENAEQDGIDADNESDADEEPAPKRRRRSSAIRVADDKASGPREVLLPPVEHQIFGIKGGRRGIMYGVALKRGKRRTFALNPDLIKHKRSGNAYGSNGLSAGTWFPYQIVALFHGAHSVSQGGISGNTENGAYSIVISGHYDDLDQDQGNVVYYSGSNSHSNTDPQAPAPSSQGTLALQASLASQRPVRVLRASSGKSVYAPIVGLRYDGLYRVVSTDHPKNQKGGLYEQFKLVRQDGQPPIDLDRPTPREQADYEVVKMGYA